VTGLRGGEVRWHAEDAFQRHAPLLGCGARGAGCAGAAGRREQRAGTSGDTLRTRRAVDDWCGAALDGRRRAHSSPQRELNLRLTAAVSVRQVRRNPNQRRQLGWSLVGWVVSSSRLVLTLFR
jgi:hypothetical protein